MSFTYAELFAGILGFGTALDDLGGEAVFLSEIDKFAQQAIRALGKGDLLHGDITKIEAAAVPNHDLLVGGFPCQAFSVGGKRLGFQDMRGTLFFEVVRIAKEKRPKVILLENVKGLVSHAGGDTISVMLHALNDIGYVVDMQILNSKFFDVPQNRERIYITAVREDLAEVEEWKDIEGSGSLQKTKRRLQEEGLVTFNLEWPRQETVTKRLRDVLEEQVDEKYYLSDDKVQKLVAVLEEKERQPGSVGHHPFSKTKEFDGYKNDISPCLLATDHKAPKTLLEEAEPVATKLAGIWGNRQAGSMWDVNGLSPTIKTSSGGYSEPIINEAAAIKGLPIREATTKGYSMAEPGDAVNFQFPDSKTRRGRVGKQVANTLEASGINQGVVEQLSLFDENGASIKTVGNVNPSGKGMGGLVYSMDSGICPALTTNKGEGPKMLEDIRTKYRIRKLTPRECWRLQAFSDAAFDRVQAAGVSNSQLYKQAGNAVTVNTVRAVAEKLLPFLH